MSADRPKPIINTLFPGRRVHLIGGASGAGKTTWLMQTIERWRRAEPIHGYDSYPSPFLYISYDRDVDDFIDTCERMHIDPATYNFISPEGLDFTLPLLDYMKRLNQDRPDARLYVIEGLGIKTPEGKINDQRIVGTWLRQLQCFCKKHDVTILATLHAAKTRENDTYKEPRAKIAGCGAWAGYASTVVVLEENSSDTENSRRTLYILPRNARKHIFTLDFSPDGLLYEPTKLKSIQDRVLDWISNVPLNTTFTVAELASGVNAASSSVYNTLPIVERAGFIQKVAHGSYLRIEPQKANN